MNIGAIEVGAEAWRLGDDKRVAAAVSIGAWATDGDSSEMGAFADDDDVTCGGSEEETTGIVGKCIGT